ncbi:MAG: FAD:protein FMN transferase [Opitutales bacterium]
MTEPTRFAFAAMGSECVFHLYGAEAATAQAAETEVLRIEHRYSRYRDDSILSRINQAAAAGGRIEVDDETAALLNYAFACHRLSDGLFDITTGILRRVWDFSSGRAPDPAGIERWLSFVGLEKIRWEPPVLSFPVAGVELDLGGLGKEYAADRAAAVCAEAGVAHGLVELGGDIRVIGPRPDGTPWPVRIRDPRAPGRELAQVPLAAGGLATSGDYERCLVVDGRRYGHILNPRTGWPVRGLAGVSVAGANCLLAGTVSTIAMLKGVTGEAWLAELGADCLWIDSEGRSGGPLTGSAPG